MFESQLGKNLQEWTLLGFFFTLLLEILLSGMDGVAPEASGHIKG